MTKVGIKFVFSIFGLGVITNNKCHLLSVTRNTIHLKKSIKEITMKKTIYASIMTGILALSFNAHAGNGAGGIIRVINQTGGDLYVTWSGVGCAGYEQELTVVCEIATIPSNQSQTYGYNWGVTTTWINVGTEMDVDEQNENEPVHACASTSEIPKKCIANHHVVSTNANDTNVCTIIQNEDNTYTTNC